MSSRRKFVLTFCFILLDMFLLIGFLVVRDATILNELKKEVYELSKLDITKDRYNREIKSKGSYAIVEKAIKEYLDSYAVNLQEVLSVMNDTRLTKMLSYDNYATDGPEFKESLAYLKETSDNFNLKIDMLLRDVEEDNIRSYIKEKTDDSYYVNLYNELMLDGSMIDDFRETKSLLEKTKVSVNNTFDVCNDVLEFLIYNKDSWTVEDGEIKFLTVDLYNYYNALISKLKTNG